MGRSCADCASSWRQIDRRIPDHPENAPLFCLGARRSPPPYWAREYQKGDPPKLHLVLRTNEAEQCDAFHTNGIAGDSDTESKDGK